MRVKCFMYSSILGMFLCGCVSMSRDADSDKTSRLYIGTYDDVWQVALKALSDYPMKYSNKDTGKLQTEQINGPYNQIFLTFPDAIDTPERYHYSLKLNLAKFEAEQSKKSVVRIRVIKELQRYQDYYVGWVDWEADSFEEQMILYRIQQLLNIQQQAAP